MERADAIIIGSGQGGVPLAVYLAGQGRDVVLFERGRAGGSCANYGCRPSKTLSAAAHKAAAASNAGEFGVSLQAEVDFPRVMERVRRLSRITSEGVRSSLESAGVRIIEEEASFTGERAVSGGGAAIEAPLVIINTGNSPYVPPIPGLEGTPYFSYLNFWEMTEMPPRLVIIGGGYIGVEAGQAMARLGCHVHIVEVMNRIIAREERDVSEVITRALRQDGVKFSLGEQVTGVKFTDGLFTVSIGEKKEVQGEALLAAVGQQPNTRALNAEAGGIELNERGFIKVDDQFRTTCDSVYAIGDVTGQPAFTHVSWEDYRRMKSILEGGRRTRGDRVHGYAFFTEPQVGRVGLTYDEAGEKGFNARVVNFPLEYVSLAYVMDRTDGFYRMVVDEDTGKILGATLVGPCAGELVHVILAHMEAGSTWQVLEESVHIHPTLAEGLPSLARMLL